MKKKLLSILLVLSLMLALVPAAFAADTGTLEGGLTWELDSTGLLTISGEGAIPDNNAGLCPQDSATREQIATILMAFCRNVLQKP